MDIILVPLLKVVLAIFSLFQTLLFVYIILGWLESFNVVNKYNQLVYMIHNFLFRIIEPVLLPIRRFLPDMGGLDLSPIIVLFAIYFLQGMIERILYRFPS
jgi:YggT family protein